MPVTYREETTTKKVIDKCFCDICGIELNVEEVDYDDFNGGTYDKCDICRVLGKNSRDNIICPTCIKQMEIKATHPSILSYNGINKFCKNHYEPIKNELDEIIELNKKIDLLYEEADEEAYKLERKKNSIANKILKKFKIKK